MSRGMSRAERLREMERRYVDKAYTDIEMAEKLGVDRITVYKDRAMLESEVAFSEVERGRWKIDRTKYLSAIRLSLSEALALYLPARRAARQTLLAQPHVANALEKLAGALKQPMTERLVQAANVILAQAAKPERVAIMETVTRGWVERVKIRIAYRGLRARQVGHHLVSPYLIEPSLWSDGAYVIGHSDYFDDLAVFKIERIEQATLTHDAFGIPEKFDEQALLRYAWGIWRGEGEPARVVLRFAPGEATRRIKESIWHPQQEPLEDLPNGGCVWAARIAEWQEMVPWIRGWGADCEVIEPKELREELIKETKDLATQYQVVSTSQFPPHYRLWAKADKKTSDYHLLLYHMIDVGQVALVLWQTGLNNNLRQRIADWLGLSTENTGRLIAFWASLHDLGKASPAFQDHPYMPRKLRERIRRELGMVELELSPRPDGEKRARHEIVSTNALKDEDALAKYSTLPVSLAELIAQMIGGHHGTWPQAELFSPTRLKPADTGNTKWVAVRQVLVQDLAKVFNPPTLNHFQHDTLKDNIMLTLVSAIVSVADWLGSDEKNFPYESEYLPLDVYARHSLQHARYALLRAEWKTAPTMPQFDFESVFGFAPRDAQQEVSNTLAKVPLPALAIIEAPMGSGKTEAAIAVYAQWAKAAGHSGLYVAMPTTATSNQMHTRVADFLSTQFGKDIEPLLVHSQALLRDAPAEGESVEEDDEGYESIAQAWFLPRKKSLLAPFGVGTVDQALMSVLQTKHFFVRLLGLSHKVIIFDEVHAYDAYMSELFEWLLIWLRELNVSVIVLSATLPEKTRQRLVQAFAGKNTVVPPKDYPRLTFTISDGKVDAIELTPPKAEPLHFDWIDRDEARIIERLADELHEGGCAVVICNTVTRAQNLYKTLSNRTEKLCDDENLTLFHARFPMAWRDEIERTVLAKFGPAKDKSKPNPDRPPKAIVIATQVVEQSLDLDFDVMVSDHAPIDLLLQRAGRLQRHAINNPRKHPFRLLIAAPEIDADGVPMFTRRDVYDAYVLLRSWSVLNQIAAKQIVLPTDLPTLIEQVYGDDEPTDEPKLLTALAKAKEEMAQDELEERVKARKRLIVKPDNEDLLWGDNAALEEDDPSVHETFQALTRGDRPGISVVCLHQVNGQLLLEPDEPSTVFDLSQKMEKTMIRELARHAVNVRHPDPAVEHFLLAEPDDAQVKAILKKWKKVAALRYHRVAIFKDGACPLKGTGYIMRLNKKDKLGLRIEKETR